MRSALSIVLGALVFASLLVVPPPASAAPVAPEETTPSLAEEVSAAAASGAVGADALAAAVGLPVQGPGSLRVDGAGDLAATITLAAPADDEQIAAIAAIARVDRVYRISPSVAITVDPAKLGEVAAIEGVTQVVPELRAAVGGSSGVVAEATVAPTSEAPDACRSIPVDADEPLRTALAREEFDVDGTGVTVGILSDSYATSTSAVTTPAEDVAAGLLPGPGNPCGYDTPVEVLADHEGGTDEGRGMAQLVHGIAPGARLLFATGFEGMVGMAENILALADAGADIIVDDISYVTEPHFQQGLISAAISMVQADGVAYYSSAGNANAVGADGTRSAGLPIAGWQTPEYRGVECPEWVWVPETVTAYDCLDFDPTDAVDPVQSVGLVAAPAAATFALAWGEAQGAVRSHFSLQLYEDPSDPTLVGAGVTPDPTVPVEMLALAEPPGEGEYGFVVVRDLSGEVAPPPAVWIGTFGNGSSLAWREYDRSAGADVVGPVVNGHNGDGSAVSVAAADWDYPWEPESFSSPGPATILFEPFDPYGPPSPAYPEPRQVRAPQITGVDGEQTSFFESPFDEDGTVVYRFYGTSAAAPTVAAVHALAAEHSPDVPATEIIAVAERTAAEMSNPYWEVMPDADVYGAGLVDGHAVLASLPAGAVDGVEVAATASTSATASWTATPGATGYEVILLSGDTVVESGFVEADTVSVVFDGLVPRTAYRVRVAALNGNQEPGEPTTSDAVETPRPDAPSVPPAPPEEADLTGDDRGGLQVSQSMLRPGGTLTVGGLPTEEWVYAYVYSSPTPLGWEWTGASGSVDLTIPHDLPVGEHRVAIMSRTGTLLGWAAITVEAGDAAPASLAVSGGQMPWGAMLLGMALVVVGAVAAGRRQMYAHSVGGERPKQSPTPSR
ncbi:fibronectin type III domain-containing protein [Microbacterium aquimaris]|uniref:fibronectin type III domain-containing protein n=1 Tax=Microbacterium aquimaris TaxID=459816 RepID=UPI002AD21E0E|nr:fibronectin type III domain-containing protein [Microbacterium aquimaris]MDZ8274722.1 fibronectin type III domain-containing protein [Microbacterium aquimaris]